MAATAPAPPTPAAPCLLPVPWPQHSERANSGVQRTAAGEHIPAPRGQSAEARAHTGLHSGTVSAVHGAKRVPGVLPLQGWAWHPGGSSGSPLWLLQSDQQAQHTGRRERLAGRCPAHSSELPVRSWGHRGWQVQGLLHSMGQQIHQSPEKQRAQLPTRMHPPGVREMPLASG